MAKKQEAPEMKAAQLKMFRGYIGGKEAIEYHHTANRKIYMIPALKAVYVESTSLVDGSVTISKANMERFYICEFQQLETDVSDAIADKLEAGSAQN